ncbi:MAG: TonB-dependent receptor [Bacteroidetes bacterium]|nr:TonB-dependent receptor [Bacteroidota bacterium]
MKYLFTLLTVLIFCAKSFAADSTTAGVIKISGTVTNEEKKPVSGANLVLEGTIDGATSDEKGLFEFETEKTGTYKLIVTAVDFSTQVQELNLEAGMNMTLDIRLKKNVTTTEQILVTASSFTSGENSKVTLTPLEIVRIPGANADLYRALTTFPGSNQVDEGSRITVRGGDPDEVITILDQATLYNPFIFDDSYNTSSFSTVNPWSLKGINFTSGGFSAKFGNALSAVLDLKSYDMPTTTGMFAVLGIGSGGLSGVYLSKNSKFGATFSVSQSYLKPFFDLNGISADYSKVPEANGAGGTLAYKFGTTGNMKLYANYSGDKIGIRNNSPSYDGFFNSQSDNYFANYKISFAPSSSSMLSASTSLSLYNRKLGYGVLDTRSKDYYGKGRIDYTMPLSQKTNLNAGVEYEYLENQTSGTVPKNSYNLRPDAPSLKIDTSANSGRIGAFVETEMRISDKFFVIPGVRTDYHTLSKKISFDPRLSMGYQVAKYNVIRGAIGMYHQYVSPQNYLQSYNNDLTAEDAIHYILGYEYNKEGDIVFRVEGYYKDYKDLAGYDPNSFYLKSGGSGFARGVDVFLKYKYENKFTGWLSYAYSDSKRKQYDGGSQNSSDYDITHNMSFTGSYNLTDAINVGITYRISTGKPYTPVTSASYDPIQNVYVPAYADKNSDRFPTYTRVDASFQYITALFHKFCVVFVAFNNIFDTKNLYQYNYNFNYTDKIDVPSLNKRIVYFGIGLQL